MADFVDQKRREIDRRLEELRPLLDEYRCLLVASEALRGVLASAVDDLPASLRRRRTRRPRRSEGRLAATGGVAAARERSGGNARRRAGGCAVQALSTERTGVTVHALKAKIEVNQTYLYWTLPVLR